MQVHAGSKETSIQHVCSVVHATDSACWGHWVWTFLRCMSQSFALDPSHQPITFITLASTATCQVVLQNGHKYNGVRPYFTVHTLLRITMRTTSHSRRSSTPVPRRRILAHSAMSRYDSLCSHGPRPVSSKVSHHPPYGHWPIPDSSSG